MKDIKVVKVNKTNNPMFNNQNTGNAIVNTLTVKEKIVGKGDATFQNVNITGMLTCHNQKVHNSDEKIKKLHTVQTQQEVYSLQTQLLETAPGCFSIMLPGAKTTVYAITLIGSGFDDKNWIDCDIHLTIVNRSVFNSTSDGISRISVPEMLPEMRKSNYVYKLIIPYNNRDQDWPEQTSINNRAFMHYLDQPFISNEGDIITILFGCGELINPANVNCTLFAYVV